MKITSATKPWRATPRTLVSGRKTFVAFVVVNLQSTLETVMNVFPGLLLMPMEFPAHRGQRDVWVAH
jgi:hypothetical protein